MVTGAADLKVSPTVLAWARASSGLSVLDAARKLAVEPERINEWETGQEVPSISRLEGLAEAYHRPLATFLLDKPPHEPPSPPDLRVVAEREGFSAFSEKTLLAFRRARRVQEVASELLPEQATHQLPRLQRLIANSSPEDAATKIATSTGAYAQEPPRFANPYQAISHWRAVLESLGIMVLQFRMPVKDARGFTLTDGKLPVIVVNQSDVPRARNFTLFHELAHLLRRSEGVCDLGGNVPEGRLPPIESWCNAFSGSFLVPLGHLASELRPWPKGEELPEEEIRRLSSRYQVSETVILRRLLTMGTITSSEYRAQTKIRERPPSRGTKSETSEVKRNIPLERVSEYGAPFVNLVLKGAYDGRLALSDVADILDIRLKHLPSISDRVTALPPRA